MLFGNEYKSNIFTADMKKVNPRCIKTDFNRSQNRRSFDWIWLLLPMKGKFDYLVVYQKSLDSSLFSFPKWRTSNSIGLMSSFLANRIKTNWIGSCNWNGLSRYKKNIRFERIILDYIFIRLVRSVWINNNMN